LVEWIEKAHQRT